VIPPAGDGRTQSGIQCYAGAVGNPTLATATVLLGIVLAPSVASQAETTSKPQKPDDEAQKQARRWVTFLEIDDRRAEAVNALLQMGPDAVQALVQALNHPRPVIAQTVAHILRVLGSQAASAKERLIALSNSDDKQLANLARYALFGVAQPGGITLVADIRGGGKVVELDKAGKVVRTLTGVKDPRDAERLLNGNYLICGTNDKKVVELTAKGEVVWSYAKLKKPYKAQRLPNGNTLIADLGRGVFEVDHAGKTVWKYDKGGIRPHDAERLVNGNTLIEDSGRKRVIEVTSKGEIVWEHKHDRYYVQDVDRLPNGNTLIVLFNPSKVIEVTATGKVVWELTPGGAFVNDADRLPNGHTLVAFIGGGGVAEFGAKGKKVWMVRGFYPQEVNRY
jgi:PQQ-like domain